MNATLLTEPIAFTVTRKGRAHARRPRFVRIEPTEKGRAAAAYLTARAAHDRAVNASRDYEGAPNWDAPEVTATGIVMTVAADWYRSEGGYICEDCQQLERCVCPDA
jgi:hypothetical protein